MQDASSVGASLPGGAGSREPEFGPSDSFAGQQVEPQNNMHLLEISFVKISEINFGISIINIMTSLVM